MDACEPTLTRECHVHASKNGLALAIIVPTEKTSSSQIALSVLDNVTLNLQHIKDVDNTSVTP